MYNKGINIYSTTFKVNIFFVEAKKKGFNYFNKRSDCLAVKPPLI